MGVLGTSRRRVLALLSLLFVSACAPAGSERTRPTDAAATPGTLRIYLARHGETEWNAAGRMMGQTDIPLDARGREQALLLRDTLKGMTIDAVYSSTLSRSRETAQAIGGGAPLVSLDSLREQHRGKFQGAPTDSPEFLKRNTNPDDSLDGGESLNQLTERVRAALAQIRKEHPAGNVVIVGHGVTNEMILRVLMNLPVEQAIAIDQANDELYLIELDPDSAPRLWKLVRPQNLGDL
jgi:broad specificity phosphatase PhoE